MAGQFNPQNLDILRRTTRLDFFSQLGVKQIETMWNKLAMDLDSDSDQEVVAFFGAIPKPQRVDRRAGGGSATGRKGLNDYAKTIVNATWKMIVPVHRDTMADAKLDQIRVRARSQADSAMAFLDERMTAVIEANANSYDNIAFFGSNHDDGTGNSHSNDISVDIVTPSAPTVAEFETAFGSGLERMRLLEDDQNRKANHGDLGLVVMVPANMERVAKTALTNTQGAQPVLVGTAGAVTQFTGIWKGFASVIVNPFTAAALNERFYIFSTSSSIKPIVYQKREEWEYDLLTEGDRWKLDDIASMITRGRWEFAGGDHKKAVRVVLT
jgi:phage major head subunit gpT-like protein